MTVNDFDVVVVGAGAAGCTAALLAARGELAVALIEKDAKQPCNTEIAGGWILAGGTSLQQAEGVEDSPKALAAYLQRKNRGVSDAEFVRAVCDSSPLFVAWLTDEIGYELILDRELGRPDDRNEPRRLHVDPRYRGGRALIGSLRSHVLKASGITFVDEYPAQGLLCQDGAVVGVRAGPTGGTLEEVRTKAVILCCDGFGANRDLLRKFCPPAADMDYVGAVGNTGDAVVWSAQIGAALGNMDSFQGHSQFVKGRGIRLSAGIPGEGGIFVNLDGLRFAREDVNYSGFALSIAAQREKEAIQIWDERIQAAVNDHKVTRVAEEAGAVIRADTAEALATRLKLPLPALKETLESYEEACAVGSDEFGREQFGPPLVPPYYAARVIPTIAHTQGGVVVSSRMEVLRQDGTRIDGLFAAGGSAVGLSGPGAWEYTTGIGLLSAFGGGFIAGSGVAHMMSTAKV